MPLLALCIPTYQRANYLRDLLDSLVPEFASAATRAKVQIIIADNASLDATGELVRSYQDRLPLRYIKNEKNIGGDRNFQLLIQQATADYIWLVGDDELIAPGALADIIHQLENTAPDLLILRSRCGGRDWYEPQIALPHHFKCYHDMVAFYAQTNPWPLLGHSLISLNVFKRSAFSATEQAQRLTTENAPYSHMFGLVEGLRSSKGAVVLSERFNVVVRETRAVVGIDKITTRLLWRAYYIWLGTQFGEKKLIRFGRKFYGWSKQFRAWRKQMFIRLKTILGLSSREGAGTSRYFADKD